MLDNLKQFLHDGEGLTIEFKRCTNDLSDSVYETVSSFSNRYGGYLLLGVEDSGEVSGVNPDAISKMKKDFLNTLNNPQKVTPTLFLALEEAKIEGRVILWCFVPPSSRVVMIGSKIFDRAEDGDMDITRNSEMVSQIHRRKSAEYFERKIFPYAKDSDFEFERLMPIVRRLATHHQFDHPWAKMIDMEIIKSAGLYEESIETGKTGYNLAAVLLFGRDDVIQSCTSNYLTDAICRRENLDRYDDRLMVKTNLIDAYDRLVEFISKHMLDKFFLLDGQSVSVRSIIARELVSNILVHRDYGSAYPAKIIIERDRIVMENWSLPKKPGRIDPNNFVPFPKNPLLARFFINIGRADVLGSGVRNLYEFTKIYSGGVPELIDGDVFKTIVPLDLSFNGVNDNQRLNDKVNDKLNDNNEVQLILAFIKQKGEISTSQTAQIIDRSHSTARRVLLGLADGGILEPSGANKNKVYRLKGKKQ
ncbi:MAG: putative DNA binding domain-containing protein [Oscillospiraceae bacterium]|jgi:ATP-dependent DNA helicase RecG|nr:putative DNA binding domain-containing protein [Oscillospiraceae bacterium]